jgi:predicted AAA+ superfamily ATPase
MQYGGMFARRIDFHEGASCFLLGPRGTGKTTWLRAHLPDAVYVDLLEARTFNRLAADPQRLGELLPSDRSRPIVIDEIQKLPGILDEVHRRIERDGHWFVLTGSSARKLRRSGVNLLGGRAQTRHFHPLTACELGSAYDFQKCLRFGLLPTVHDPDKRIAPEDYLSGYVQTYLREEVLMEGLSRNLGGFARLLEAASFSQAQLLNVSAVARECQIKRKMAESYFDILEDLLLAVRLPVFAKRARRRITQHPKFFLFDTGVFRALRPTGPLDSDAEIDGPALETLVLQELRATLAWCDPGAEVSYWRTATGLEVDFVVYSGKRFIALEVKRKRDLSTQDLQGLRAFHDDYPEAARLVLYGGDETRILQGVHVVPLRQALPRMESVLAATAA